MGARIAVRSYSHCPQTGRMYYKPPSTTPATANNSGNDGVSAGGVRGREQPPAAAAAGGARGAVPRLGVHLVRRRRRQERTDDTLFEMKSRLCRPRDPSRSSLIL